MNCPCCNEWIYDDTNQKCDRCMTPWKSDHTQIDSIQESSVQTSLTEMVYVTCKRCGRVSFSVTKDFAVSMVESYNAYYDGLTQEKQAESGRRASLRDYEVCAGCGGSYKDVRPFKEGDVPSGCTINSILSSAD